MFEGICNFFHLFKYSMQKDRGAQIKNMYVEVYEVERKTKS